MSSSSSLASLKALQTREEAKASCPALSANIAPGPKRDITAAPTAAAPTTSKTTPPTENLLLEGSNNTLIACELIVETMPPPDLIKNFSVLLPPELRIKSSSAIKSLTKASTDAPAPAKAVLKVELSPVTVTVSSVA